MKQISLILLTLVFAVNVFSQTNSPMDFFSEFWNLALKNDFETAKKQTNSTFFGKEKLESLKQVFQTVSKNGMIITKIDKKELLLRGAEIVFRVKGKDGQEMLVRIRLIKPLNVWQIMSLETFAEVLVESDKVFVLPLPTTNYETKKQINAQILPLEPYNEKKNPATFLTEPYNEKKNPAFYQFVPKNP